VFCVVGVVLCIGPHWLNYNVYISYSFFRNVVVVVNRGKLTLGLCFIMICVTN